MDKLTNAERELVALGAALASNCVPCIEYHIPEARKAGLSDEQIKEAIRLADKVRQAPAKKVLDRAVSLLQKEGTGTQAAEGMPGCMPTRPPRVTKGTCCG